MSNIPFHFQFSIYAKVLYLGHRGKVLNSTVFMLAATAAEWNPFVLVRWSFPCLIEGSKYRFLVNFIALNHASAANMNSYRYLL